MQTPSHTIFVHYENDDFLILYKPANLNFHSEDNEAGCVVLAQKMFHPNLWSVHRLDKMTSGLLILAKSSKVANDFATMFQNKEIQKYYLAIATKKPKKKQGWIKADMAPSRRGSYKLLQSKNNPAVTQFCSKSIQPNERLFLLKPYTGKTHQLRVALKSIGAPIAGDIRYANAIDAKKEQRGYLHAYGLAFSYKNTTYHFTLEPLEGERFVSDACKEALKEYATPWEVL